METSVNVTIREAAPDDLPAVTDLYNWYITNTAATFDVVPFHWQDRQPWFDQFAPGSRHQLLVLELDTRLAGFASSRALRPKAAYDTSVETSIYLANGTTGRGLGRRLYGELLDRLRAADQEIHRCYGIVTQPNDASMSLHRRLGFAPAAHLHEVGYKFDRYWDTIWMELRL